MLGFDMNMDSITLGSGPLLRYLLLVDLFKAHLWSKYAKPHVSHSCYVPTALKELVDSNGLLLVDASTRGTTCKKTFP